MATWVLSDLHLADDSVALMFEEDRQGKRIEKLCARIEAERGELVLLGDVFDLTGMTPPSRGLQAFGRKVGVSIPERPTRPVEALCAGARKRHPRTLSAIGALAKTRPVILVPGNHDHALGGADGKKALVAAGLEAVTIEKQVVRTLADRNVVLQHGHEYDHDNAHEGGNGELLTRVLHHAVVPMLENMPPRPNVRIDPKRIVALRPEERMVPVLQRWLDEKQFLAFSDAFLNLLVDVGALHRVEAWLATPERLREKLDVADALWERVGTIARRALAGEHEIEGAPRPDVVVLGHTHVPDWASDEGRLYVNLGSWTDRANDAVGPYDHTLPLLRLEGDARGLRATLEELETARTLEDYQSW